MCQGNSRVPQVILNVRKRLASWHKSRLACAEPEVPLAHRAVRAWTTSQALLLLVECAMLPKSSGICAVFTRSSEHMSSARACSAYSMRNRNPALWRKSPSLEGPRHQRCNQILYCSSKSSNW
ncbi:hypothetical protein MPTK1_4g21030 [Marchantia polymorpha subsp. ruderalis]|uniref:Sema domain-containing protein n=2 Tax=Marchantia polymorpha TaxID=3197 RepID=A0AAF6BC66_MARPO|nr:hypothetical protein MARPO_0101s0049 [Marchantia polymorpha]BBN09600.1 hypothetical protein Mp_4g21030 [Marchantia polymorpha subsp. ruderalis]|eukprot:PTQ32258.1 hypothetical protein MARPO_0101s0049 [Marchantia polymorpha]